MNVDISIEDLVIHLGGAEILHGISLRIPKGSFVTLLGPSGSGKTTTLNAVAGLLRQTSGHIRFDDDIVDDLPPARRGIGFVFQSYALFPHMTVEENVEFSLVTRRVPAKERQDTVARVLELVQMEGMQKRATTSLSGGQQQRIAVARALASDPRALLLDEPLAALDRQLRDHMQVELRRIQRATGLTTVAVTHDQTEAMTMSDQIAIMDEGRIAQFDEPQALYRRPASLFVANFLGEANLLPVEDGVVPAFNVRIDEPKQGTAVFRPDQLVLRELQSHGVGSVPCELRQASFQGDRYRVIALPCERTDWDATSGVYLISVPPSVAPDKLEVGSTVHVACDPRDLHAIPAGPQPTPAKAVEA